MRCLKRVRDAASPGTSMLLARPDDLTQQDIVRTTGDVNGCLLFQLLLDRDAQNVSSSPPKSLYSVGTWERVYKIE